MTDVIGGLRQAIQDLVAPDLKAIQAKQDSTSKLIEVQHDAIMKTVALVAHLMIALVIIRCRKPVAEWIRDSLFETVIEPLINATASRGFVF